MNLPGANLEIKTVLLLVLPCGSELNARCRCVGCVCHARVSRDPVHFPGLASVVGEGLLKSARIRSDVRNNKTNKDSPVVECFLVKEFAASILELADRGLTYRSVVAIREVEAPLMGLRVVQAQRQTFDVA